MKPRLAPEQLRLAFRALRTSATHMGNARVELPLGEANDCIRECQLEVERVIERLRAAFGVTQEEVASQRAAQAAEVGHVDAA